MGVDKEKRKREIKTQILTLQHLSDTPVIKDPDIMAILKQIADRPSFGKFFEPFVSPKNFMGITILAKELEEDELRAYCCKYIDKHLDIILTCSSFKSCELDFFLTFLNSFLDNKNKLILALTKLAVVTCNAGQWSEAGNDYVELMNVTTNLMEKYPNLGNQTTVKQILAVVILEIAILAERDHREELKFSAEFLILENFGFIIEYVGQLAQMDEKSRVMQYLNNSSLPIEMLQVLKVACAVDFKQQSIGLLSKHRQTLFDPVGNISLAGLDDSFNRKAAVEQVNGLPYESKKKYRDSYQWYISQLCKMKQVKSQTIGPAGGLIKLDGCTLTFPEGAVREKIDITVSLDANTDNFPKERLAVAPILEVKPFLEFGEPVKVNMTVCFRSDDVDEEIYATVLSNEFESVWKPKYGCPKILLGKEYGISFETKNFFKLVPTVTKTNSGQFSIQNDIFIQRSTSIITSCFYIHGTNKEKIRKAMEFKKSNRLCSQTLEIDCYASDELTIYLKLINPKEETTKWTSGNKVSIAKLVQGRDAVYSIQTEPRIKEKLEDATIVEGNYEIRIGSDVKASTYLKSECPAQDGDVLRLNGILKETVSLRAKDSKYPKLTLENCFEISTDAIQCNDGDRLNKANAYIRQNLETICASDCLKTLDWCAFERFLENPGLEDFTKLQLVEAKLRSNPNDSDEPQYHETDVEVVKVAARLSTEFRDKYQALAAHVHTILKSNLSDSNCIEMAVLAHQWKLDELKIWAQFRVIKNFHSITSKIVNDAYATQDLIHFLKMTSLPHDFRDHIRRLVEDSGGTVHDVTDMKEDARVCNTDQSSPELEQRSASGASPIFDQDVLSKKARDWALKELSKLSSRKTKTIGKNGGVIELDGCSLTFPEGALHKDTDITMTVNTDPDNCPATGMPITPVLGVEPSMSFDKPVKVRLQTCFAAERGHRIPAQLSINHGSGWKHLEDLTMNSNYEICFDAYHFSNEGITTTQTEDGRLRLQNYISIHIRTGLITSSFYLFDKDRKDIKKEMRESSRASFCPHSLDVDGKLGELLKLELKLRKPEMTLSHDDWIPDNISMREIQEKGRMHFDADPDSKVTSLSRGSYISGIYKVFVGSQDKSKAAARVKQEWPAKLDPECKDPPNNITASKVAMGGSVINEANKDGNAVVANNYHN